MGITLRHRFASGKSDGVDPTLIQPSNWNADHDLATTAGKIIGSDSSGPATVQELPGAFEPSGDFELTAAVGYFLGAQGTTAQRPMGVAGRRRYNIDANKEEFWDTAAWQNVATEAYVAAQVAALGALTTGDVKFTIKSVADTGWVLFTDGTMGSGASGATYANDNAQALFLLLWANVSDSYAPVTGGRGVSAAADWASNKKIQLLSTTGRAMGVAGSGAGLSVRALGQFVGVESHLISATEIPIAGSGPASQSTGGPVVGVGGTSGQTPISLMSPITFLNAMIKL